MPVSDVSVIIPAYNAAQFVAEAIESVLAQDLPPREIVVVNDGSTDSTEEVLNKFGDRIRVVRQANGGLGRARNRGIAESTGEFLALLDADDRWMPHKLSQQMKCFAGHPEVGLVHSDVYDWSPASGQRSLRKLGRGEFKGSCLARLAVNNRIVPSTVVMKRECIQTVGDFDPLPAGVEDWDLWLRIAQKFEIAYVDEPLIEYRRHESNMSLNSLQMRSGELYVLKKHLQSMPELKPLRNERAMKRRLKELAFDVGYHYFARGERAEARRYFGEAIGESLFSAKTWAYWLATYLPGAAIGKLRNAKQQLGSPRSSGPMIS